MRAVIAILLPLVVSALLASCLEIEEEITIRADGSGTQKLTIGMNEELLATMRASARALDASAGRIDPQRMFTRASVEKELAGAGLELAGHRTWKRRRRRFVEVEATFTSLDRLRASPLAGPGVEWRLVAGKRPGVVHLILYPRGRAAWLEARKQSRVKPAEPREAEQRFFERRKQQLAGLDLSLALELPGDVLVCSANLRQTGPRKVTARVRAADIRTKADLLRLLAPRFEVAFDGRACTFRVDRPERYRRHVR